MVNKFSGRCLPFGEDEASIYAQIIADTRSKGKTMTVEDGQIAALTQGTPKQFYSAVVWLNTGVT